MGVKVKVTRSNNVDMRVDNRTTTIRISYSTLEKLRQVKSELNRNSDDDTILALIMFYSGLKLNLLVAPPGFEPGSPAPKAGIPDPAMGLAARRRGYSISVNSSSKLKTLKCQVPSFVTNF